MVGLNSFLISRGLINLAVLCTFIPTTTIGIYIIFGKYVYFHGPLYLIKQKIFWGVLIILSMPLAYLLRFFLKKII